MRADDEVRFEQWLVREDGVLCSSYRLTHLPTGLTVADPGGRGAPIYVRLARMTQELAEKVADVRSIGDRHMPSSVPLYRCTIYQSSAAEVGTHELQNRLRAHGIPCTAETSPWRDCERVVPSSESPGGWDTESDSVAQQTILVPEKFLAQARTIMVELGLT